MKNSRTDNKKPIYMCSFVVYIILLFYYRFIYLFYLV